MARIRSLDVDKPKKRGRAGIAVGIVLAVIAVLIVVASMEPDTTPARRTADITGPDSDGGATPADDADAGTGGADAIDDGAADAEEAVGDTELFAVSIKGETFNLERALTPESRLLGLSYRREIAADGGMVFAFVRPAVQQFVMRHCYTPIDILYLNDDGTVINAYAMAVEPAQRADESDRAYEFRLRRYPSRGATRLVIELAGGTIERLGIERGDRFTGDFASLFAAAVPNPTLR